MVDGTTMKIVTPYALACISLPKSWNVLLVPIRLYLPLEWGRSSPSTLGVFSLSVWPASLLIERAQPRGLYDVSWTMR